MKRLDRQKIKSTAKVIKFHLGRTAQRGSAHLGILTNRENRPKVQMPILQRKGAAFFGVLCDQAIKINGFAFESNWANYNISKF